MNYRRVLFLYGFLPLLSGLLIYLLFREGSWLHSRLFDQRTQLPLFNIQGTIADIVKFQLPDFCWTFSLSAALMCWKNWWGKPIPFFYGYLILLAAGAELIQVAFPGKFTVDLKDLFAAISAVALSVYLIKRYEIR